MTTEQGGKMHRLWSVCRRSTISGTGCSQSPCDLEITETDFSLIVVIDEIILILFDIRDKYSLNLSPGLFFRRAVMKSF